MTALTAIGLLEVSTLPLVRLTTFPPVSGRDLGSGQAAAGHLRCKSDKLHRSNDRLPVPDTCSGSLPDASSRDVSVGLNPAEGWPQARRKSHHNTFGRRRFHRSPLRKLGGDARSATCLRTLSMERWRRLDGVTLSPVITDMVTRIHRRNWPREFAAAIRP